MKNVFIILILSMLVFGCSEGDTDTETVYVEAPSIADEDSEDYVVLSSYSEKGPCNKDSDVTAFPLHNGFYQTGDHYLGGTKTDSGYWEVPAQITEDYVEVEFEGICFDERYGGENTQEISAIVDPNSDDRNINPLTTIAVDVIREVYRNQIVKDKEQAIIDAEELVADVFDFGTMNSFSSISLNDGDINAAKLAVASAVILQARDDQSDFMIEISWAIINENTTAVKLELAENMDILPILTVNNNLKTKYESLNAIWDYPPMHTVLGASGYYGDLMNRNPSVMFELNLDDNTSESFDTDGFNWFAIPYVFTQDFIDSGYAAFNISGDYLSVYSTKFDVYERPDSEVFVIEKLKENLLDGPTEYQGIIGDSGVTAGVNMWLVIHSDVAYRLSKSSGGPLVSFGRVMASQDGVNWVGHDNSTPYFRRQGLIIKSFN